MTYAAQCLIKGTFDGAKLKIRFQLHLEENLVRLFHSPLYDFIGHGIRNLGGFDPASSLSTEFKTIHGIDEYMTECVSYRRFFRMVTNAHQFAKVFLCHRNLS